MTVMGLGIRRMRTPIAIATAAALFTACYAYKPLDVTIAPKVGERERFNLTIDGTNDLARFLGPSVVQAEGSLTAANDSAYVVDVDFVQTANGVKQPWTGEGVVSIPKRYVAGTLQRTYQPRQTLIASVATAVLLMITAKIALNSGVLGGDGGAGGVINP